MSKLPRLNYLIRLPNPCRYQPNWIFYCPHVESNWVRWDPYPDQRFRGFFTNAAGDDMQAVLQDPAGDGDGTVVFSSGKALEAEGRPKPGDKRLKVHHQPAYEDEAVQKWAVQAIKALAKAHFYDRRTPPPEPAPETTPEPGGAP